MADKKARRRSSSQRGSAKAGTAGRKPKQAAPAAKPKARSARGSRGAAPKPRKTAAAKPERKSAPAVAARNEPAAPKRQAAPRRRGLPRPPAEPLTALEAAFPGPDAGLTDEERIESSKYASRERPRRVFEEERFLFPESYESDRVRLLVKDPEWLFAHWDVSRTSLAQVREAVGERTMALSRLTLKLEDPADGALSIVLLPEGARSWYVRTRREHHAYRAQLGLTMPSGEFRALATSNVVVTPRVGPSHERARRRVRFSRGYAPAGALDAAADAEDAGGARARKGDEGVTLIDGAAGAPQPGSSLPARGGASDVFGPGGAGEELGPGGASDVFRPSGASDSYRR